ncbi:MAG: hypothetical protein KTR32_09750 [Granulosicoccus sp.]|nr:hypothetical protein [Granulosicoccus sp.]
MDESVLTRALQREKARREKAEKLLEDKSRELFLSYETLQQSNDELENALAEVKSQQHQLVQSEKMASLGIMSAGVAHEINNPLAFVFSNVNSLEHAVSQFSSYHDLVNSLLAAASESDREACIQKLESFSNEADLEYLFEDCVDLIKETTEGIGRVKAIVSGLQSFARTDSGTMETLDLHECINNTLKLAHNQIKYSADVETHFGDIPKIQGFPGKLGQVFLNLLVNAGHAMGNDKGKIVISTSADESRVTVSVADTGSGMDKSTVDNIFLPFFTTKEVGKGTGLGLSISHGIIEEHQGTVEVSSVLGEGTTFTLSFPVSAVSAQEQAA